MIIRDLRIQLNMTQKQVAELTNYSTATISRAENDSKFVSSETKENIIKKLKSIKNNINYIKQYEKIDQLVRDFNLTENKDNDETPTKEKWWTRVYNFIINLIC